MMRIHSNLVFTFDFIPLIIPSLFPVNKMNIARADIQIRRGHFYEGMCHSVTAFYRFVNASREKLYVEDIKVCF